MTPRDLGDRYGWDLGQIAHELAIHLANGCRYCRRPFDPSNLGGMTVDIVDPERPPYWRTNTAICCFECNQRKRKAGPDAWEERINGIGPRQMTMFDDCSPQERCSQAGHAGLPTGPGWPCVWPMR